MTDPAHSPRRGPLRRHRGALAAIAVLALTAGVGTAASGSGVPDAPPPASAATTTATAARATAAQAAATYVSRPDLQPPAITLHMPGTGDLADGSIFLAPKLTAGAGQTGPLIVDNAGRPIWFRPNRDGVRVNDFRVQEYRGKPVLTWWEGRSSRGHGQGTGVIADTSYRIIKRIRARDPYDLDLHEFKLTDRGTALVTIYHTTRRDLRSVGGRRNAKVIDGIIQEIDVRSGRTLFTWHSLGNIALKESYRPLPEKRSDAWDYFHPNSVDVDDDGNYIVSARYSYSVTKISRRTGKIIWRLGGKRSDFHMGRGTRLHLAHDAEWQPDGTLRVFDNSETSVSDRSRVVWLKVDAKRRRVTLARELSHPDPVLAATQGNAESLPDGRLFVGWGSQGRWSEFAKDGSLRYDAELPDGFDSYRVYRQLWEGHPRTKPSVAARTADGATTVYASWNGATEVARWRVLAGASAAALAASTQEPRQGFETAIAVPGVPPVVAVQALDRKGHVLATSRAVNVAGG
jgi:hypothetical protein